MLDFRKLWQDGLSFEAFVASCKAQHCGLWQGVYNLARVPDWARNAVPSGAARKLLVIAEDWCGDVIANLPVLGVLAREAGTLDLRIFLRDQNKDLMQRYLNQGKFESIPVFAFFDDQFNELGVFIERPASVTERRAEQRKKIHAEHPEFGAYGSSPDDLSEDARARLTAEITKRRDDDVAWANREVVRALREIVERSPAAA
jgi:hypothetical protein